MRNVIVLMALGFASLGLLSVACKSDEQQTQKVAPQTAGQRGERCQARNDCEAGLACIMSTCSQTDFAVNVAAKSCDQVDCETTADCCGNRATQAPAKCKGRESICTTPRIPGCITSATCTDASTCGGGSCRGSCSNGAGACTTDSECAPKCDAGFCTGSFTSCTVDSECTGTAGTCLSKRCNCTNPAYDPTNPICTDTECENICTLVCNATQRCVQNEACTTDAECPLTRSKCSGGKCVACVADADCSAANEERCLEGSCKKPCTANEECPLFHACDGGKCVERGCTSDRECILAASRTPGTGLDPRLAKCLPSDSTAGQNECKIPCVNDAECGTFNVCENGFCKFIGCETNEECRSYLGLENEMKTTTKPFVPKAVCR